jgi:cell fate regulator YaaT (PSP1 superfamily)
MAEQRVPVGVRFKEAGKIYYFDASEFDLDVGNYVIVDTPHGEEIARVVIAPDQVIATEIKETLKPVIRLAGPEDLRRASELREKATKNMGTAQQKVEEHCLDMRLISSDYDLGGSELTFYFTADERVDFRSLVKDLSSTFQAKVQLLQVGERDRAKMVDGIGRCGERLCCSSWLTSFPTVSIKMAKEQDLPLNPGKISGVCGRLLCCLTYEYEAYRELRGTLPKVGTRLSTPAGEAKIASINVPKQTVTLLLTENMTTYEIPALELQLQYGTVVRPAELVEAMETPLRREKEVTIQGEAAATEAPTAVEPASETPPAERPKRRRRGRRGGRRTSRRRSSHSGETPQT